MRATHLVVVNRQSVVRVEGAVYSVPSSWAGLDATAHVSPAVVTLLGRDGEVVQHPRLRFGQRSVDYRHYLAVLAKKPQALRQVAPELMRDLGAPFASAWQSLCDQKGPLEAARAFAKVLQAVVEKGIDEVARLVGSALDTGEPILLALRPPTAPATTVASECIPEALRGFEVEQPTMRDFDLTLGGVA